MALSTDVTLPRDQRPEWPERCVGCGAPKPEPTRVSTRKVTLISTLTASTGGKVSIQVPACPDCARRIRGHARLSTVAMIVTILAGAFAGQFLVAPHLEGFWSTASVIGCALGAYLPVVVWQIFWAPLFAISADSDSVDYEFADEDYAREFAELNGGEAI